MNTYVTSVTRIKKSSIKSWESGKIYLDNLLYNETYGPNSYADCPASDSTALIKAL